MSPKEKLLKLTKGEAPILAPGGWDALSAKMIERAGFRVCFLTGGGITASLLCEPDAGVLTMTEMARHVSYICEVTSNPVIADGDSGFGNALNAMRTVREMEKAGAAAVAIEDRITPPNHWLPPEVAELYPLDVAVKKIAAAVKGIREGSIAVVARTDAPSIDEAISRGTAFVRAGAEMFFPHGAPNSFTSTDVRTIADSVGVPTIVNLPLLKFVDGHPPTSSDFHGSMAKILIFPRDALNASLAAGMRVLKDIRLNGRAVMKPEDVLGAEFAGLIGMHEWTEFSKAYLPSLQ